MSDQPHYPYADGDTVVLGPQVFASADGETISWQGANYQRDRGETSTDDLLRQSGYLRDQFAVLAAKAPVPQPTAEELADGATADKVTAQRIHSARPGIPLHHVFAVLQALRAVHGLDRPVRPDGELHGLTVQQEDVLWDAVAIPGPETPTFVKQHERVCKAAARLLAEATSGPHAVLDDVRALRDDLREITGGRWIADALDTILGDAPAHDAGPSVAEAKADDRRWWGGEKTGEQ